MKTQNALILAAAMGFGVCSPILAQQASITLTNSDVAYCYKQEASWSITKTNDSHNPSPGLAQSGDNVNWTVTATRGPNGPTQLCAVGTVIVTNTGTAPATIGNIVVNVQRSINSGGNKWQAFSADVADAVNGDGGRSGTDTVVAGGMASQTDYSLVKAPTQSYGPAGFTFTENAYSGTLQFTDASNNTVWAITPQQTIPVGGSVTLLFNAQFFTDGVSPALVPGANLRTEVLVTFGNAGARGGSGASATNMDINGDGGVDLAPGETDEKYVRSVPARVTKPLPQLQICNDTVTITDTFTFGGTTAVSLSADPIGAGVMINGSQSFIVSGIVSGAGLITNTANLDGTDSTVSLLGGTALGGYTLPCCTALHLSANSSVTVGAVQALAKHCSYSTNEFLHNGAGNPLLVANYASSFPNGLRIGSTPQYYALFSQTDENQVTPLHGQPYRPFEVWLGGGGPNGALTANVTNPTTSAGGNLAENIATLTLNVSLSGVGGAYSAIGNLVYHNAGDAFDGLKVTDILAAANVALGGGALPSGYSYNDLNHLIDQINQSWNKCNPNALVNSGKLADQ